MCFEINIEKKKIVIGIQFQYVIGMKRTSDIVTFSGMIWSSNVWVLLLYIFLHVLFLYSGFHS